NSVLIEEEIRDENSAEEVKPEALREETDNIVLEKKRKFPVTLVLGIICGGLICIFLFYLVQSKMGVTGNSDENRFNKDSVNAFLERYFNSLNDKKSNADQFFAD